MRKYIFLLLFALVLTPLTPVFGALYDNYIPTATPTQQNIQTTTNALRNAIPDEYENTAQDIADSTFQARKDTVLRTIDTALEAVGRVNTSIDNSLYLSDAQQQQLLSCTSVTVTRLETYKRDVQAADNQEELTAAHQKFLAGIQEDQDDIKNCVNTAVMIGIGELIEANKLFIPYAEAYAKLIGVECPAVTADGQQTTLFEKAKIYQKQLEEIYAKVYSDFVITSDEQADVQKGIQLGAEKAATDYLITECVLY